jgi:polysaccharide biosynthesis protein PelG
VTSGPWLLTIIVLVLLRVGAVSSGVPGIGQTEIVITVVYAVVIVLSAPIDIVLSRYASDRVYEKRRERIAAPLRRVLAGGLLAFFGAGALAMLVLRPPLALAIPGAILAGNVGGQWLLMSAAGGLSSPGTILRAFALGAPVSVLSALLLARPELLGSSGYLYGFGTGQIVTFALLLRGTLRALPAAEAEEARIGPAFATYWMLALAALAFHTGIWIDKVVVYLLAGGRAAAIYAATAAVAWLSVVPACAYLFVTVETIFERRFRGYYSSLHAGASLPELEGLARELRAEVDRTLRGTAAVQVSITLLCLLVAPTVSARLALAEGGAGTLSWLLVGAALQMLGLAAMLLLYYFDFRAEACLAAVCQLAANGVLTWACGAPSAALGAGYAIASGLTCVVAILLLRRRLGDLLLGTFQSQPYPAEA